MGNFTEKEKQAVWEKGTVVKGHNKDRVRKDKCGAWIRRERYGRKKGEVRTSFSWEIDHIDCNEENNEPSNLRPLQWANNNDKSDKKLKGYVTSSGNKNVDSKPKDDD
ncbi:MAG TPA: HNH endonuclease [bacterium]|nr:HNH endonuclease [bacterium]